MSSLENYCDLAIDKYKLFQPKDKLLLACSGGKDSTALFHYLRKRNYEFSLIHIDYNIREDSGSDAQFVRSMGSEYNIPCEIIVIEKSEIPSAGIQEWARNIRYKAYETYASANNIDFILTAHSLNDHLETYLMNMGKGRNLWNGAGISVKSGNYRRPLLLTTSEQVYDYLSAYNYSFRVDKSNFTDKYERNRIRKNLLPVFNDHFQDADNATRKMIDTSFLKNSALQQYFAILKKEIYSENNGTSVYSFPSQLKFPILKAFFMDELLPLGFHPDQISQALLSSTGSEFNSDSHILLRNRAELHLRKLDNNHSQENEYKIPQTGTYEIGDHYFSIEKKGKNYQFPESENQEIVQLQKRQFPLSIRKWRAGDQFQPLGMNGKKKVKSFLTDLKIDKWTKAETYVLLDVNDEILWVVPYRISEKVKIKEKSPSYRLHWE